jgi:hypothetical protein
MAKATTQQSPAEVRRNARRLLLRDAKAAALAPAEPDADELRHQAMVAHYRDEIARFALKPWETAPVFAGGDPPAADDTSMGARTWRRARELRDGLLRENPRHYDDTL